MHSLFDHASDNNSNYVKLHTNKGADGCYGTGHNAWSWIKEIITAYMYQSFGNAQCLARHVFAINTHRPCAISFQKIA